MASTYLTSSGCQVILDVISRRYIYDEDDERTEFMCENHNFPRDIIESLKRRKILDGYGDDMRVRYEYYVSANTQRDLGKDFLDFENPTEIELIFFELERGVDFQKTMIGQYVHDKTEIAIEHPLF